MGREQQRVAAYAVVTDEHDRVLLVLSGPDDGDRWFLPGGGVEFGEDPEAALRREVMEETGQQVDGLTLRHVLSDVDSAADRELHSIRIIYDARVTPGRELRDEVDGSSVRASWVPLRDAPDLELAPFVRVCLDRYGWSSA
ncbi:MAG: NUDIX domain-containing protein [Nocardioides sp.]